MHPIRYIALSVTLLFACIQVQAQKQNTITILSEENKKPLENVTVIIQPVEKNTKATVLFTDNKGTVNVSLPSAAHVNLKLIGYRTASQTIEPGKSYTFLLAKENYELNEVVVTGQYNINTTDQSVYSVKVIDEKEIAAKAATSLDELLQSELNIRLSEDNILGTAISMNGLSGQNVKIMVDGVPVIGRENGNIDISQLNLNDIERVEIIQGPMSVMYGTDAIGGLINLITKQTTMHGFEGNVNLNYETIGTYNADGSIYCKNKTQHFSLSGGRYFFGGFPSPDSSRFRQWKPWEKYFGSAEYGFKTKWIDGQFRTDYFHQLTQSKGVPIITPYEAYAFDDYYTTDRFNFTALNRVNLRSPGTLQFTNSYSLYRRMANTFNKNLVDLTQFQTHAAESQDTSTFDLFLLRGTYSNTNPKKSFSFQTGYDINLESGRGEKLKDKEQRINDYALFGSIEFKVNNFLIRPGIRVAYNSRYNEPLIPSLNVKYKAGERIQLRSSYSRGFRAPSLKELDLYFVDVNHNILGNPDLKAEHSDHFDFSVDYQNVFRRHTVKLEYSLFYNNVSDIIILAMVDSAAQQYSYINIDKYQTAGTKIEMQWRAGKLTLQSGFSLTGLYNSLSEQYEDVQRFSFTPEFVFGASCHFDKIKSVASLFLKSTGTTPGFAVNNEKKVYATTISPYTTLDIVLQKSFWTDRINLSAGVKNILNVINVKSTAIDTDFHSSNTGSLPYAMGRYFFVKFNFKLYKS